ncbi:MAG: YafY family transcriptional regulator, partial [Rhodothermales bacterium]|nr:YafY family transcriptional regulator [Rhodothermales bacterium]
VSRRTIFRDLRALSDSGVPLTYSEGGGYEILEGYQLPPLMLSAREAATLLVGTEFMKLQSDASLREDADDVALKIRTVLPTEIREYVDRLRENTVLDPYWLHAVREGGSESGRWYRLSEAVARSRKVIMEYFVEARQEVTKRRVDPLGLVYYTDHWNLIAYDHLRNQIRNFRLDRIQEMYVLTERFERPEGFDLQKHLEASGVAPGKSNIVLRFAKTVYQRARVAIPARLESEREDEETIEVRFVFDNLDYLASWLLRYGDGVKVLSPEPLQAKHKVAAEAVLDSYV